MHDRKLPEVIASNFDHTSLIGTQSPKKADYNLPKQKPLLYGHFNNLNEVVRARRNVKKNK